MGKKSGPAPPPAPDPYATAAAQTQSNVGTATANAELNRYNQYTPYGNSVYTVTGHNPDGTPIYSQSTSLSAAGQQQLDLQNKLASSLLGTASGQLDRVNTTMNTPFNFDNAPAQVSGIDLSKLPQMTTGVNLPGTQRTIAGAGGIPKSLGPNGTIQGGLADAGGIQRSLSGQMPGQYNGNVQTGLDFSGAPALPGTSDFSADRNNVTNAMYNQATSRLDPQFQQRKSDLASALANQGIATGSDAWQREMDNFSRDQNDAYGSAMNSAINAGGNEQSRLFGLALGARQQAVGEDQSQGQFANSADAQRYGYASGNRDQMFNELYGEAGLNNTAQSQAYQQLLGTGQFSNDAQAQRFAQSLAGGNFANAAQGQQYEQNANNAAFYNSSGDSQFQQMLANAGLANSANQQAYNQQQGNATLANQARQQSITEQSYLRNLPLQDVATLMGTAGAPQSPQFQPVQNAGVANTDLGGMVYDSYNGNFNAYQTQQQQQAAAKGQMFGSLGSVGGAIAMSDRRLKHDIQQIGTLWNGIKTYVFSYLGESRRVFGVMADEVAHIPGAVLTTPDGYNMVDYGKVW